MPLIAHHERLKSLLSSMKDVVRDGDAFVMPEDANWTVHVGDPGQGLEVRRVQSVRFSEGWVEVLSREMGQVFVSDEKISVVILKDDGGSGTARTGFAL